MPQINGIGKPAGVRCAHLLPDQSCAIFGHPERPAVCASLMPSLEMCGQTRQHAMRWLGALERQTQPARSSNLGV